MAEEWGSLDETRTILFAPNENKEGSEALFKSNSLSGGERHRMFMRRDGNYKEYSLVSGVDFRVDGCGVALLDIDNDGYLDMGITSPNHPRFRVMRNRMGDQLTDKPGYVRLSLVGGQTGIESSTEWSPRDAFGSQVLVTVGDQNRMFHLSLGEGLSGQNAKWIHIGLGQAEQIDQVEVLWPSGKKTTRQNIGSGEHLTLYENPDAEP